MNFYTSLLATLKTTANPQHPQLQLELANIYPQVSTLNVLRILGHTVVPEGALLWVACLFYVALAAEIDPLEHCEVSTSMPPLKNDPTT